MSKIAPLLGLKRLLWRSGIRTELMLDILAWQIAIVLLSLVLGACSLPFSDRGLFFIWFGFGGAISAWNFFALIKFIQNVLPGGWKISTLVRLLVVTNVRVLLSTGLVLVAIGRGNAPLSAILTGLAVLLVCIIVITLKKTLINLR